MNNSRWNIKHKKKTASHSDVRKWGKHSDHWIMSAEIFAIKYAMVSGMVMTIINGLPLVVYKTFSRTEIPETDKQNARGRI